MDILKGDPNVSKYLKLNLQLKELRSLLPENQKLVYAKTMYPNSD